MFSAWIKSEDLIWPQFFSSTHLHLHLHHSPWRLSWQGWMQQRGPCERLLSHWKLREHCHILKSNVIQRFKHSKLREHSHILKCNVIQRFQPLLISPRNPPLYNRPQPVAPLPYRLDHFCIQAGWKWKWSNGGWILFWGNSSAWWRCAARLCLENYSFLDKLYGNAVTFGFDGSQLLLKPV